MGDMADDAMYEADLPTPREEEIMRRAVLTEEELAAAKKEAAEILAQPTQEYTYRDDTYRGGPRNLPDDVLQLADIEILTARLLVEEIEDRLREAEILLYLKMEEHLDVGVPVDRIAKTSGLEHRSSVYRIMRRLPRLLEEREAANKIRKAFTRGDS